MIRHLYGSFLILIVFSILAAVKPCLSQEVKVANVSFQMKPDSTVSIRYSLSGPADREYKVSLILRRQGDPNFTFTPINVSGDVGQGKFEGPDDRIVWNLYDDMPDGLYGTDYYFEVTAALVGGSGGGGGGIAWYYYVGGAVVVGGAAAVLLKKSSSPGSSGTSSFPLPPARP